jgi:hypothetical protein
MKKLSARILTPLSIAVLFLAGTAYSQYAPRIVKVHLPFEFSMGDKIFPGGDYSMVTVMPGRLDLRDAQARVVTSLFTHPVQTLERPDSAKLEFSTAAGGHALLQVWFPNDRIGYEIAPQKALTAFAKRRSRESDRASAGGNK